LPANPFNHVVKILLFVPAKKFKLATRAAATAHVHMDIGVALLDVPFDWPGLAPEKCACRKIVVVEPVRRRTKQSRIGTRSIGAINTRAYQRAVADIDLNNFIDHERQCSAIYALWFGRNAPELSGLNNQSSRPARSTRRHELRQFPDMRAVQPDPPSAPHRYRSRQYDRI
jgi:hypothetical protein